MEITANKEFYIITPLSPKLNLHEVSRLEEVLLSLSDKKIGIDLKYVQDCTSDFFEKINEIKNISLFNIPSDIFAILNFMNLDKIVNLYVSEQDFLNSKRRLLSRNLTLLPD